VRPLVEVPADVVGAVNNGLGQVSRD
jgi:hypothetical protein